MRRLLCVTVLLLCFAYGGIVAVAKDLPHRGNELWHTYVPYTSDTLEHRDGWKPIRIAVNMGNVLHVIDACGNADGMENGKFNQEEHPNVDGRICKQLRTLGHAEAVNYFREIVIEAVKIHADRLLVKRVVGNLSVVNSGSDFPRHGPCEKIMVSPDDTRYGIKNADVVLFVDLTPADDAVTHICKYGDDGRPITANIRLRPKDLRGSDERFIRFLAHHIAHAIGFDTIANRVEASSSEEGDGGSITYNIEDSDVKKRLKEHLKCGDDDDVSVIKMERKKGQVHFPSDLVKGELMSPHKEVSDSYRTNTAYSPLTLAVLESTGHFKADYGKADGWGDYAEVCRNLKQ